MHTITFLVCVRCLRGQYIWHANATPSNDTTGEPLSTPNRSLWIPVYSADTSSDCAQAAQGCGGLDTPVRTLGVWAIHGNVELKSRCKAMKSPFWQVTLCYGLSANCSET